MPGPPGVSPPLRAATPKPEDANRFRWPTATHSCAADSTAAIRSAVGVPGQLTFERHQHRHGVLVAAAGHPAHFGFGQQLDGVGTAGGDGGPGCVRQRHGMRRTIEAFQSIEGLDRSAGRRGGHHQGAPAPIGAATPRTRSRTPREMPLARGRARRRPRRRRPRSPYPSKTTRSTSAGSGTDVQGVPEASAPADRSARRVAGGDRRRIRRVSSSARFVEVVRAGPRPGRTSSAAGDGPRRRFRAAPVAVGRRRGRASTCRSASDRRVSRSR